MPILKRRVIKMTLLFMTACITQSVLVTFTNLFKRVEITVRPYVRPNLEIDICRRKNSPLPACRDNSLQSDKSFKVSSYLHTFEKLNELHGKHVMIGGHYSPPHCQPSERVAIIIPYRDREKHLRVLLNNLHQFLKRQNIDYTIIVVEQLPGSKFNRGMLKNIGFVEALRICDFDCFFFHDVDMIPDNYGNVYRCGQQPRHHARNLTRWKNKPPYVGSFGGVVSMKTEQFIKVNGYPNSYFEWGAEDDELGKRITLHEMNITSYPRDLSSYKEPPHEKSTVYASCWIFHLSWRQRAQSDGLNSLYYNVDRIEFKPLYTHIYVNINMSVVATAYNGNIFVGGGFEVPLPSVLVT